MTFAVSALLLGTLSIVMALTASLVKRLPLSPAMFYLGVGFALGPAGMGMLAPDPFSSAGVLEHVTEVAVLISLFAVGLKLGRPSRNTRWVVALRLASVSMALTVALIAAMAVVVLGLEVGAAVLLAAALAPTDPVLASDVQVVRPDDRDPLRFSLTGEGGLNDGTAFPFVMLGLGLLGVHELGAGGWRWIAVDVVWAVCGGLAIGAALGAAVGKVVVHLRTQHREAVGRDEFLALGLVAVAAGSALLLRTYGFLAVFAAGVALRHVSGARGRDAPPPSQRRAEERDDLATHSEHAGAYLTDAVGSFNDQLERFAELAVVVALGAMLPLARVDWAVVTFVALVFAVARPLAVTLGLVAVDVTRRERALISWFGIRGIGTMYYVLYALERGLPRAIGEDLLGISLTTVAVSIVVHGVSVTPLMNAYGARRRRRPA